MRRPGPTPAATLVVAGPLILIASTKWGSYLGIPGTPIFLTDVCVLSGTALFVLESLALRSERPPLFRALGPIVAAVLALFLLWVFLIASGPLELRVRDAAPLVYALLIPGQARAVRMLGATRVLRWLRVALTAHLLWVTLATVGVLAPVGSTGGSAAVQFFQLRKDVDSTLCGVLVVICLLAPPRHGGRHIRVGNVVSIVAGVYCVVVLGSRAGLFATLVAGAVAVLVARPWRASVNAAAVFTAAAAVSVCLGCLLVVAPSFVPADGTLARIGFGRNDSAVDLQRGAESTADARQKAWSLVWHYTTSDPRRVLFGAGPGREILAESGALAYLSGEETVRSPHNGYLGFFARFGAVGLSLLLLWLVVAARSTPLGVGAAESPPPDRALVVAAAALLAAVGTAALVGVVLESPFGYLPAWFAVGMIAARRRLRRPDSARSMLPLGTSEAVR